MNVELRYVVLIVFCLWIVSSIACVSTENKEKKCEQRKDDEEVFLVGWLVVI